MDFKIHFILLLVLNGAVNCFSWSEDDQGSSRDYSDDKTFTEHGEKETNCWAKPADSDAAQYQTCPLSGNERNPCDGQTYIVANQKDCERVMRQKGCAAALLTADNEGSMRTSDNQPLQHCKMLATSASVTASQDGQFNVRYNVTEVLFFKMRQGAGGPTPADAFLTGAFSPQILFPRTNAAFKTTGTYYKSPLWLSRRALGANQVKVAMHGNQGVGAQECQMTFGNAYEENGSWFRKEGLLSSSPFPVDYLKVRPYHVFSISNFNRQFITAWYDDCPRDVAYMLVLAGPDPCPWAKTDNSMPKFVCAANLDPNVRDMRHPNLNLNHHTNFMREFEITGVLPKPMTIIYAGEYGN